MTVSFVTISHGGSGPGSRVRLDFYPVTGVGGVEINELTGDPDFWKAGPYSVTTGASGGFSLEFPTGTHQDPFYVRVVETPITTIPGRRRGPLTIGTFPAPTEDITYEDMIGDTLAPIVVSPSLLTNVGTLVAAAETARDEAEAARDEAEAFGGTNDAIIASKLADEASATYAAAIANSRAYASRALGWRFPEDAGAKGDGMEFSNGAMTSGTAILTTSALISDQPGFANSDVGKLVRVVGAGAAGVTLKGTILSYQSATQVTLSVSASTTVSAATFSYATDDSTALQAWIDNTVRGRGISGYLSPNKAYAFNAQLIIPGDAHIRGAGANNGTIHQGGTELWWFGTSGTNAIATALDAETDWSRGLIRGFRIVNKATANTVGYGLHVRNAQNLSLVDDVTALGFPDGQFLWEETKTTGTLGATPGLAMMHRCFAIGGKVPITVRAGSQPVEVVLTSADTAADTITAAFLVAAGPVPSTGPRANINLRGCKAEHAVATTTDIPGFLVTVDAAIHLDGCQTQHNTVSMTTSSTRGAVEYTPSSGSFKKWGRIKITQLSTWLYAYAYRNTSLGFDLANPGTTSPWVTNFDWADL